MQSIKRDLVYGVSMCALVFVCALAWGSPFVNAGAGAATTPVLAPHRATHVTVFGTIVRERDAFVLEDAAGQIYVLQGAAQAAAFDRKAVRVTGQLNEQAGTLRVASIEIVPA